MIPNVPFQMGWGYQGYIPLFCPESGWTVTPVTTWGVPFTALTMPG